MIINGRKVTKQNDCQGVYVVTVRANDKTYVYVGSGNVADRITGNKSKLKKNKHDNKTLQNAYNISKECSVSVLEFCDSKEEARIRESDWIDYCKKLDNIVLCNKAKPVINQKEYKYVLSSDDVVAIKQLINEGYKNKEIATLVDVNYSMISNIRNGRRWANVVI